MFLNQLIIAICNFVHRCHQMQIFQMCLNVFLTPTLNPLQPLAPMFEPHGRGRAPEIMILYGCNMP